MAGSMAAVLFLVVLFTIALIKGDEAGLHLFGNNVYRFVNASVNWQAAFAAAKSWPLSVNESNSSLLGHLVTVESLQVVIMCIVACLFTFHLT